MRIAPKPLAVIIAAALLLAGACWWRMVGARASKATAELVPSYIGDQSCKACHREITDKYQRNGMRRTWQVPTAAESIEDYAQNNHVFDERRDLHYEMIARDGQFFQREYRLDEQGSVIHELERQVSFFIGSGEHARGYVTNSEGYLNETPIWWFTAQNTWDLSPSAKVFNYRFERALLPTCVACHSDDPHHVQGTFNRYEPPMPGAITCERCHGPAEWHVREQRDGWEPPVNAAGRQMFVNPARLPAERKDDVCFQCHLQGEAQFPFPDQDPLAFRPGLRLADYRCDYVAETSDPDEFGIVGHAARMVKSRCYVASEGRMHCTTCHDPHTAVRDVPPSTHRQNCLNCHAADACNRVADSSDADRENDCISCHMPRAQPASIEHTVATDHWIRRPRRGEKPAEPPPSQPAQLRDFWDDPRHKQEREGIAYVAYAVFKGGQANLDRGIELLTGAASRGELHREGWRRLGMAAMLKGDPQLAADAFGRAVKLAPNDATLHMSLGSALRSVGDPYLSLAHFEKAIELSPGLLESYLQAASIELERNQPQRARKLLEQSLRQTPYQLAVLATLGAIYSLDPAETPRAIDAYSRAVQLEPDAADLRVALGSLYLAQNDPGPAREQLQQALRAAPDDVPALLAMARLHMLLHEKPQAIERVRHALRLQPQNPYVRSLLLVVEDSADLDSRSPKGDER